MAPRKRLRVDNDMLAKCENKLCGRQFIRSRKDKLFCTSKCRSEAWNRERRRAARRKRMEERI